MTWFRKRKERKPLPRLPLEFEEPSEWTDADQLALGRLMNSISGQKLKKLLLYEMYSLALTPGQKSDYEQGIVSGMYRVLTVLMQLGMDNARSNADE